MIAFHKNTTLKQLIETKTVKSNQNILTPTQTTTTGRCTPCYTSQSLCPQQFLKTTTFASTQTRETFTTFHQVTCHSDYVIYLLECVMCKIQYVGKSETVEILKNRIISLLYIYIYYLFLFLMKNFSRLYESSGTTFFGAI